MTHVQHSTNNSLASSDLPTGHMNGPTKESLHESISSSLDALASRLKEGKSEALVHYLDFVSRFHHYSFHNTILIALACPEATHVAGFNAWKNLRRHVKKGEKGIPIFAPVVYKRTSNGDEQKDGPTSADTSTAKKLVGFRIVYVFDVSQTEGEPVPDFMGIRGDAADHLKRLKALTAELGIELSEETIIGGALGVSKGGVIVLRPGMTDAEATSVLAHEIAHELLHKDERRKETDKRVRETEAEAVAYVVCHHLGLDTTIRSSDYIQLYQGDTETLAASLDAIQRASAQILRSVMPRSNVA